MTLALLGLIVLSLLGITIILANKAIEEKKGVKTFFGIFLAKFDVPLGEKLSKLHVGSRYAFDRTHMFVRHDIPNTSINKAKSWGGMVKEKYRAIAPNVRGKRTFRGDRKASAFLQDIQAHQEKEGKGRIEDDTMDMSS